MTDNELLLNLSNILDKKLAPINDRIKKIELTLENSITPRLQTIEACYTSTYNRYQTGIEHIDSMQSDIQIIKGILVDHSEKLQKIS